MKNQKQNQNQKQKDSESDKAVFTTGTAAEITGIKPKTIINYDSSGLVQAGRSQSNRRRYSRKHLFRILIVNYLVNNEKMTFSAVKKIIELEKKLKRRGVDLYEILIPVRQLKRFRQLAGV